MRTSIDQIKRRFLAEALLLRALAERRRRIFWWPQATITLVQSSSELAFTGTTNTITITPTAGNTLIMYGAQVSDGTAIIAPSDTQSNSWTIKHTETAGNGCGAVAVASNVAGASTVITLGVASGSKAQNFVIQEWSGCLTTGQPDASDSDNQAASTTHNESAAGINPSGGCLVFSSSSGANNLTSPAVGSGYTKVTSTRASVWWQYQIFTSAPTSEQALWTSANSLAQSGSMMAIKAAAAGSLGFIAEQFAFHPLSPLGM